MISAPFRFDAGSHSYVNPATGELYPHITGLLKDGGWIDDQWFTDACRERGSTVHSITSDYDLGALDPATYEGRYRGWLLAHVKAMSVIKPFWNYVEQPAVHPEFKFGGRPDRVGKIRGLACVVEIKSGPPEPAHAIQTALQALLVAPTLHLPPEAIGRFAIYLKASGKFSLERHERQSDISEAMRLIRRFAA